MTTTTHSYATPPQLIDTLKKYQNTSAFIGLVFLALLVAGYFMVSPEQFLRSWLVGFWMWFGTGAGCLLALMTQYLTGGAWGVMIRKPLEAGAKTLYVMAFGFLPLILFHEKIYWWTTAAGLADKRIHQKELYLNVPFFELRWVIYVVFWFAMVYLLTKWSKAEADTKDVQYSKKLEALSAFGVVAFFFTMTFCGVDYLMVLEPHWFSTMFGFIQVVSQGLSALCVITATLVLLARFEPMKHALTKKHFHDIGKLMFAFVMLWAYTNFGQLIITWSGNLPDEIIYYIKRMNGGWGWVATGLIIFHFFVPFFILLSQTVKRTMNSIWKVAVFILVMRCIDTMWLVEPNFLDVKNVIFNFHWLDIVAPIGFGGLWLAVFFWNLPQQPLLAEGAPDFQKALNHGRDH
jgi:hypothetical protein